MMNYVYPAIAAIVLSLSACGAGSSDPEKTAGDAGKPSAEASAACEVTPPAEPMACTMEWRPVCGCDGKTYSNPCSAKAAGVPEFTAGECPGNGRDQS